MIYVYKYIHWASKTQLYLAGQKEPREDTISTKVKETELAHIISEKE